MKFPVIISVISLILLTSCNKKSDSLVTNISPIEDKDHKDNLAVQTDAFVEVDSSGILIFPLSVGEIKKSKSLSYKETYGSGYWNMVFYDTHNSQYLLLTDKKILIQNYDYKHEKQLTKPSSAYIFYTVISEDFNKDTFLNEKDPKYLYVSDKKGEKFRQISPSGYNLIRWELIESTGKVLMTVQKDSNKNLKFEHNEEIIAFEFDLETSTQPKEVFSPDFKKELKTLFDKHWQIK